MSKISLEQIKDELSSKGWDVISEEYKNLNSEMIFQCPEGHNVNSTWKVIRADFKCPICSQNKFKQIETSEVIPKTKNAKRVLALDQSTHITGYAIFDNEVPVQTGIFNAAGNNEIERCAYLKNWLINKLSLWSPDFIALEGIQFQENSEGRKMGVTVFQALARLQGILMITCYESGINFEVCPTNTWRNYCGVKGRARTDKKRSMMQLVKQWYDITTTDDIADAIGIGRYAARLFKNNTSITNWE